jgi:acetyl-CoA carboxylase biotin carboxyl carrier protein
VGDCIFGNPFKLVSEEYMSNDTFDLKRIKQLVELMRANDLTELDIQQGESQIKLRRGSQPAVFSAVPPAIPAMPPVPSAATAPAETREESANTTVIKSPMVGTFYTAASPDSPPFIKVGDHVTPEKTICLIEAMKVYNEIQAECTGKIVAVLAASGETVEYGRPLFRVTTE